MKQVRQCRRPKCSSISLVNSWKRPTAVSGTRDGSGGGGGGGGAPPMFVSRSNTSLVSSPASARWLGRVCGHGASKGLPPAGLAQTRAAFVRGIPTQPLCHPPPAVLPLNRRPNLLVPRFYLRFPRVHSLPPPWGAAGDSPDPGPSRHFCTFWTVRQRHTRGRPGASRLFARRS